MAPEPPCLVQTPCAKTPEFGEAEFWGLFAGFRPLECFSANETGVLISEFSVS